MTAVRHETDDADIGDLHEVVDPVPGAGAPHLPQQPDLVQLLTPEGERLEPPDYPLDVSDEELETRNKAKALLSAIPPAEAETRYYARPENAAMTA